MNAQVNATADVAPLESVIEAACCVIAPQWPLDRQIAVNPFWGLVDQSFGVVATSLRGLSGTRLALEPALYLDAWRTGEINIAALERAMAEAGVSATTEHAIDVLRVKSAAATGLPLPSDVRDLEPESRGRPRWRDLITQQISQFCASHFDDHQADWRRHRCTGLYSDWRANLLVDHALEPLMHAPRIRAYAAELPGSVEEAIRWALDRLRIPQSDAVAFLRVCLLRINGWAAWCAYLHWQAMLDGRTDASLRNLLAIRSCWEALLFDEQASKDTTNVRWREQWMAAIRSLAEAPEKWELIWQRAQEISYQDRLVALLSGCEGRCTAPSPTSSSFAQLAFCIDVRSERFRRALESIDPQVETCGFAGFFGLPIQYQMIGTDSMRPQLPGLLAPLLDVTDSTGTPAQDDAIADHRRRSIRSQASQQPFLRSPTGAFALVETIGPAYAGAILRRHFGYQPASIKSIGLPQNEARLLRPRLRLAGSEPVDTKAELVANILRAMSLTAGMARLLVLVGHGSRSANNPQAASLDCGACGGQTGEVNARVLAGLLNDAEVRAALVKRGITIPDDTLAVAALHDTTTDEVFLLDVDQIPTRHAAKLRRLRHSLQEAGHRTRAERAPALGLQDFATRPGTLLKKIRRRSQDWAETRPEWGLANNAAFIVAPRSRTRGVNLEGRCFLHDYIASQDPDGHVLELIMTAPMVVAHWINLQYYVSTVDPERFGSGNKVLHNVACGRIGVFEGNTGDLRIGLSRQSLHDGQRWMHTPLRLTVIIDAPRERIDAIVVKHRSVRQLIDNRWLYLMRYGELGIEWRCDGVWRSWERGPQAT